MSVYEVLSVYINYKLFLRSLFFIDLTIWISLKVKNGIVNDSAALILKVNLTQK